MTLSEDNIKFVIKSLRKILNDSVNNLKNTADEIFKLSSILEELENKISEEKLPSVMSKIYQEKEDLYEMTALYNQFKNLMEEQKFNNMTPDQRRKALEDMSEAIKILTREYDKT